MDIAARLQEELNNHNSMVEQRDQHTARAQQLEVERQACFGRIQILKEIADGEGEDEGGSAVPAEPAPAPQPPAPVQAPAPTA